MNAPARITAAETRFTVAQANAAKDRATALLDTACNSQRKQQLVDIYYAALGVLDYYDGHEDFADAHGELDEVLDGAADELNIRRAMDFAEPDHFIEPKVSYGMGCVR